MTSLKPINRHRKVRHFSTSLDRLGVKHYYVTYDGRGTAAGAPVSHEISADEFERYQRGPT